MRLRRVEAVRYGRLAGQVLGELGDGLTVVHGPNEAGKSTFTSLVRHVLYGYPTQREREPGYFVEGAGRLARLVFEDEAGSWVIERAEGPHGGDVQVRTLAGAARPSLVSEITRGVSSLAYRVVFGFGLDELARIEELRGSDDDIIERLYAASAGLRVSPHELRALVERESAALFKPTGRKREVNTLVSDLRGVRSEMRALRQEAESFAADQQRLSTLEEQLVAARDARDATRTKATELALAVERADAHRAAIALQEETLLELRRERKRIGEEIDACATDAALLAAAPALDAVLEESAGYPAMSEALSDAEAALARARTRAEDAAARTGLAADAVAALAAGHDEQAAVEEARDDLQRLQLQVESREEAAARAAAAADGAADALAQALSPLHVSVPGAAEAIAERFAALDAIESARVGRVSSPRGGSDVPALVMLISGIAAVASGWYLAQWVMLGIGVVLVAAAAWFLLRPRLGGKSLAAAPADERPYLQMLGLPGDAGALELSRARRALEAARQAVSAAADAATAAEAARRDVELARDALSTRRTLFDDWLTGRGLDAGLAPSAALRILGLVREAATAEAAVREAALDAERMVIRVDAMADALATAARPFVEVGDVVSRADVPAIANRLRERLIAGRDASARREELSRAAATADSRIAAEGEREARARADLADVLARFDLAESGSVEDLRLLHVTAERDAAEADALFESLSVTRSELSGKLEAGAHEQRGGELRLRESGLAERLAETVDRYLVLAVASRLLSDAQERYQRERQPEVVRHAERLFTTITGGRYTALSMPLGEGRITVFDAHAEARTSDVLSRGAAEQLYLALRLGLISQLGDVGANLPVLMDDVLVDFDPGRKRGAAEAIAELASGRQVVFFTCHPETVELFAEAAPGHADIDLSGCVV